MRHIDAVQCAWHRQSCDTTDACMRGAVHMACPVGCCLAIALAELLLEDDGAGTAGKFLVRSKGASTDVFIISVIYKGQPTHHNLVRDGDGEEFALNKQPTGCTNISDVLEKYRSKQPKWPVPLTVRLQPRAQCVRNHAHAFFPY